MREQTWALRRVSISGGSILALSHRALGTNRLLAALASNDFAIVAARCQAVELRVGELLHSPDTCLEHAYFPTSGFISLVMPVGVASSIEVALVGDEGMFGLALALGVNVSPLRAIVRGPGTALRMDAALFRRELRRSQAFEREVNHYLFVHMQQLAQATACARFHVVEERLARWLLMTQDRARSDTFHLTHESLACMLGVRRVGITRAAGSLQTRDLIHYSRGDITVIDRPGLREASCACYEADRRGYTRILG